MPPDWLPILTACAAVMLAAGLAAYRGGDRDAGRDLIVIGTIGLLCAAAEWVILYSIGR